MRVIPRFSEATHTTLNDFFLALGSVLAPCLITNDPPKLSHRKT